MSKKVVYYIILGILFTIALSYQSFFVGVKQIDEVLIDISAEAKFIDFVNQKKKLSQENEKVFFLDKQYYYWDKTLNDFTQETRNTVLNDLKKKINYSQLEIIDLNHNSNSESYELLDGSLIIRKNKKLIWQSPDNWWIDSFVLADTENDGEININLSLWKRGSFGSSKPFWLEENDMSIKNHFFVLRHADNLVSQAWSSSNLTNPNCEFIMKDVNNDGQNDLVVIEGEYQEDLQCIGKYIAVWSWNGWGFSNYWRSEKANYTNLEVEKIGNKSYIIVETY